MIDLIDNLYWQRPLWLLCIPIVLVALGYTIARKSQQGVWAQHIDTHLLKQLTEEDSSDNSFLTRKHIHIFLAIGFSVCCVALSGPSWDRVAQPALDNQQRLILISDMTLSMLATDVKPNRLSQQKFKIRELLKNHRQGHMALIAFSGDAHVVTPFTEDYKAIDNLVSVLSPEIIPSIGSKPESALKLAIELLEKQPGPATIIIFTDEILGSSAAAMETILSDARKTYQLKDIPITMAVVGIGTKLGSPIKLPSGRFLVDSNNNIVSASLDKQRLKDVAKQINADYLQATADNSDVERLQALASAAKSQYSQQQENLKEINTWRDMGGWVALLVVPFFLSIFRKGYILPCLLILSASGAHVEPVLAQARIDSDVSSASAKATTPTAWQRLWKTPDQLAQSLYDQEEYQAASELFEEPSRRGYASAKANNYERATQLYSDALPSSYSANDTAGSENSETKQLGPNDLQNLYNRAYSQAHQGLFEAALNDLESALSAAPNFEEALKAKTIIEGLLENTQQNQPSKEGQNNDPSSPEQSEDETGGQSEDTPGEQSEDKNGQQSANAKGEQSEDRKGNPSDEQQGQQGESREKDNSDNAAQRNDQSRNASDEQLNRDDVETDSKRSDDTLHSNKEGDKDDNASKEAKHAEVNHEDANHDSANEQEESIVQQNALDAWLNQVEDDPSGLLRRKFEYERSLRQQDGTTIVDNENSQIW